MIIGQLLTSEGTRAGWRYSENIKKGPRKCNVSVHSLGIFTLFFSNRTNELVIIEAYFHLGEEPKKQLTPR